MAAKAKIQNGQNFCLACAGEEFYLLTGKGISSVKEG
ncbi:MAG: hypothetical protein HY743_04430 [Deltaproteobacteria bacterium]|nr:hypothetical protein [Deltaproteobacteria bacterium]